MATTIFGLLQEDFVLFQEFHRHFKTSQKPTPLEVKPLGTLFRKLIYVEQKAAFAKLTGVIEIDESYFGSRRVCSLHIKLKRGRGTRKQPVERWIWSSH